MSGTGVYPFQNEAMNSTHTSLLPSALRKRPVPFRTCQNAEHIGLGPE